MSETDFYKKATLSSPENFPPVPVALQLSSIQRAILVLAIEDKIADLERRIASALECEDEADALAHRCKWLAEAQDFMSQLKSAGML